MTQPLSFDSALPAFALSAGTSASGILQAIRTAAAQTGVDFSYLLNKAAQESGLNPTAHSSTSSAAGLFQFTGQTWLSMVKKFGDKYGLSAYASQISQTASGALQVASHTVKQAILALRQDPQIASAMAGELDKENAKALAENTDGPIGATELYLAHFLGASGASDFLNTLHESPSLSGASVLPRAAAANPSVFYTKSGEPRTLAEIYHHFAKKFESTGSVLAQADPKVPSASVLSIASVPSLAAASSSSTQTPVAAALRADTLHQISGNDSSSTLFAALMLGQNLSALSSFGSIPTDHKKEQGPSATG